MSTEDEHTGRETKPFKRLVNTGTIDPYVILWSERPTRYIKEAFAAPIVFDADLRKMSAVRLQQAQSRKIVVGGMTRALECVYDEGECLAGKSTVIILARGSVNLKVILAILNSALVTFWYRAYYNTLSLAGGYLRIGSNEIKTIPIAMPSVEIETKMVALVDRIMKAKSGNSDADVGPSMKTLDALIYAIYGLSPEQIQLVEDSRVRDNLG